jgi:hypothetical protein
MTAAPNAPTTDTSCKDLNNEPGLQGGFANGRDGKSIEQVSGYDPRHERHDG